MNPRRIWVVGAGGVGSYVAGWVSKAQDVTIIDSWTDHVRAVRSQGLQIDDGRGTSIFHPRALEIHEVCSLLSQPVDAALICVKSYDTPWAVELIKPYVSESGFFVTLQNGVNEDEIERRVGTGRVMGTVVSGLSVNLTGPARVLRSVSSDKPSAKPVFRVGEMSGTVTEGTEWLTEVLGTVDTTVSTTSLWRERWEKLATNCTFNGPCALLNVGTPELERTAALYPFLATVGWETLRVGAALGHGAENAYGFSIGDLERVAKRDAETTQRFEVAMLAMAAGGPDTAMPSTAQDIRKGRRTEVDWLNGLVAEKGQELGSFSPANEFVAAGIRDVERGLAIPGDEKFWKAMSEWTCD